MDKSEIVESLNELKLKRRYIKEILSTCSDIEEEHIKIVEKKIKLDYAGVIVSSFGILFSLLSGNILALIFHICLIIIISRVNNTSKKQLSKLKNKKNSIDPHLTYINDMVDVYQLVIDYKNGKKLTDEEVELIIKYRYYCQELDDDIFEIIKDHIKCISDDNIKENIFACDISSKIDSCKDIETLKIIKTELIGNTKEIDMNRIYRK